MNLNRTALSKLKKHKSRLGKKEKTLSNTDDGETKRNEIEKGRKEKNIPPTKSTDGKISLKRCRSGSPPQTESLRPTLKPKKKQNFIQVLQEKMKRNQFYCCPMPKEYQLQGERCETTERCCSSSLLIFGEKKCDKETDIYSFDVEDETQNEEDILSVGKFDNETSDAMRNAIIQQKESLRNVDELARTHLSVSLEDVEQEKAEFMDLNRRLRSLYSECDSISEEIRGHSTRTQNHERLMEEQEQLSRNTSTVDVNNILTLFERGRKDIEIVKKLVDFAEEIDSTVTASKALLDTVDVKRSSSEKSNTSTKYPSYFVAYWERKKPSLATTEPQQRSSPRSTRSSSSSSSRSIRQQWAQQQRRQTRSCSAIQKKVSSSSTRARNSKNQTSSSSVLNVEREKKKSLKPMSQRKVRRQSSIQSENSTSESEELTSAAILERNKTRPTTPVRRRKVAQIPASPRSTSSSKRKILPRRSVQSENSTSDEEDLESTICRRTTPVRRRKAAQIPGSPRSTCSSQRKILRQTSIQSGLSKAEDEDDRVSPSGAKLGQKINMPTTPVSRRKGTQILSSPLSSCSSQRKVLRQRSVQGDNSTSEDEEDMESNICRPTTPVRRRKVALIPASPGSASSSQRKVFRQSSIRSGNSTSEGEEDRVFPVDAMLGRTINKPTTPVRRRKVAHIPLSPRSNCSSSSKSRWLQQKKLQQQQQAQCIDLGLNSSVPSSPSGNRLSPSKKRLRQGSKVAPAPTTDTDSSEDYSDAKPSRRLPRSKQLQQRNRRQLKYQLERSNNLALAANMNTQEDPYYASFSNSSDSSQSPQRTRGQAAGFLTGAKEDWENTSFSITSDSSLSLSSENQRRRQPDTKDKRSKERKITGTAMPIAASSAFLDSTTEKLDASSSCLNYVHEGEPIQTRPKRVARGKAPKARISMKKQLQLKNKSEMAKIRMMNKEIKQQQEPESLKKGSQSTEETFANETVYNAFLSDSSYSSDLLDDDDDSFSSLSDYGREIYYLDRKIASINRIVAR